MGISVAMAPGAGGVGAKLCPVGWLSTSERLAHMEDIDIDLGSMNDLELT